MAHIKAQIQIRMDSGLLEDYPVNTLHFSLPTVNDTILGLVHAAIAGAYDTFDTSYPATVEQNLHRVKMYNMADPTPRAPVWDDTFNLTTNPTGDPLPSEIALCVSFQGDRVSGQSQARRRGRIYLGPLAEQDNDTAGRPAAAVTTDAGAWGAFLLDASLLDAGWTWCVYSATDDELVPVTNVWVDNAWDVQRRRGLAPSVRFSYP